MRLFVVRHGQTEDNVARRLAGHQDGQLTPLGTKQVELLGERLQHEKIDRIYSSDLGRARSTTRAISRFHTCPITYTEALRERSYGTFQGQAVDTYLAAREKSELDAEHYKPEDGESAHEVFIRVKDFLDALPLEKEQTILLSAHSEVNRYIFQHFLHLPYEVAYSIPQHNACLNIFDFRGDDNFPRIIQNDTEHLDMSDESK